MPFCSLPDVTLYYETHGEGEPLLLLHGLGSSTRDWEKQVAYFADSFRVITVDLRGHGRSGKPAPPYRIPQMASDVAALLEKLDVRRAHVTGLSMGGMIALQLALDHPERVRSVAAVNCGVDYRLNSIRRWIVYLTRLALVRLLGPYALGLFLARKLLPDPDHETLREAFIERYSQNDPDTLVRCINAIAGWSILDRLHEIRHPTLIVAAENDYSTVSEKLSWAPRIPRASFTVIPQTHHALPVEQPWHFNTHLEAFLDFHRKGE